MPRVTSFALILALAVLFPVDAADTLPTLTFPIDEDESADTPAAARKVGTAAGPAPVPESGPASARTVQTALGYGVAYLRSLAEKDDDKWIVPPVRHRKREGYEEVEVQVPQYTKETYTVEVPVYEWKVVEEYRDVKVGSSVDAVKVRRKVKVRKRKQTGTREVKRARRVVDKSAPKVTRTRRRPVYGPGGPDEWNGYDFGHNAMAIFAMMEAGAGADDQVVESIAHNLLRIYETYGFPDLTWDLAWSTAAFSVTENEDYREMARQMAGKLLDGQITEGKASGLWGPVCVNPELLAAMAARKTEYSRFYLAAKQTFAERKKASYEKAMNQALEALRSFAELMTRVTMIGTQFTQVDNFVTLREEMGVMHPIKLAGLPQYPYNQTAADIESTAVVLFALRVAAENDTLPEETWRPKVDRGRHLIPPRRAADVMKRALTAMGRNQNRDGSWSEMNVLQPVRAFDTFEVIEGVPADLKSFKDLASPTTRTSTAQAYSVLAGLAGINGVRYLNTRARNVVAGNRVVREALAAGIEDTTGGRVAPYDYCFALRDPPDLGRPEFELGAWSLISDFLVETQNDDGSWGPGKPATDVFIPSSVRERMAALPALRVGGRREILDRSLAHVPCKPDDRRGKKLLRMRYAFKPRITSTAYAVLYLASEPVSESGEGLE